MGASDSSTYKLEAAEQIEKIANELNILGAAVNFADIFEMTLYTKSSSSNKAFLPCCNCCNKYAIGLIRILN